MFNQSNVLISGLRKIISSWVVIAFVANTIFPSTLAYGQGVPTVLNLPLPGTQILPTNAFTPTLIKGVNIHADNPLRFDFIIDKGTADLGGELYNQEISKLIKYFLAALTTPEEAMWVNLSPYEKDRIVPGDFGKTEMGRDLLAQDYLLKQLTASLMDPQRSLGEKLWKKIKESGQLSVISGQNQSTTDHRALTTETFNKVWIVPQEAQVYEHEKGAFVVKSHLKVMLDEDYLALEANQGRDNHGLGKVGKEAILSGQRSVLSDQKQTTDHRSLNTIREVIIPVIEKEVNEGETFANLRQIYNSVILASWYKKALKDSLLGQVYVNQHKTEGIEIDSSVNQQIYDQYVKAFEKGVYDYIKEEYDPKTQQVTSKKYFSGGMNFDGTKTVPAMRFGPVEAGTAFTGDGAMATVELADAAQAPDAAMLTAEDNKRIIELAQTLVTRLNARLPEERFQGSMEIDLTDEILLKIKRGEIINVESKLRNKTRRIYQLIIDQIGVKRESTKLVYYVISQSEDALNKKEPNKGEIQAARDSRNRLTQLRQGDALRNAIKEKGDFGHTKKPRSDDYAMVADAAMVVEQARADNVQQLVQGLMKLPADKRIVLIVNTPFVDSNEAVISFLNSGRTGIIALKGLKGVFSEFYFDGHPKAVGVSRQALKEVGIDVPEDGILDPWSISDRTALKEKILNLKEKLNLPLAAIERLEQKKFETLKQKNAQKIEINAEPFIFNEGKSAYANFHILDLKVIDKQGKQRIIRTYQNSPVITDEVTIVGVGPETVKVWRKIVEGAQGVILIGDDVGFEEVLRDPVIGQQRIYIDGADHQSHQLLNDPQLWLADAAMVATAEVRSLDNEVYRVLLGPWAIQDAKTEFTFTQDFVIKHAHFAFRFTPMATGVRLTIQSRRARPDVDDIMQLPPLAGIEIADVFSVKFEKVKLDGPRYSWKALVESILKPESRDNLMVYGGKYVEATTSSIYPLKDAPISHRTFKYDPQSKQYGIFNESNKLLKGYPHVAPLIEFKGLVMGAMELSHFSFSSRVKNAFQALKISTIDDLVKKKEADLMVAKNFGEVSLEEVKSFLADLNLKLADETDAAMEARPNTEKIFNADQFIAWLNNQPERAFLGSVEITLKDEFVTDKNKKTFLLRNIVAREPKGVTTEAGTILREGDTVIVGLNVGGNENEVSSFLPVKVIESVKFTDAAMVSVVSVPDDFESMILRINPQLMNSMGNMAQMPLDWNDLEIVNQIQALIKLAPFKDISFSGAHLLLAYNGSDVTPMAVALRGNTTFSHFILLNSNEEFISDFITVRMADAQVPQRFNFENVVILTGITPEIDLTNKIVKITSDTAKVKDQAMASRLLTRFSKEPIHLLISDLESLIQLDDRYRGDILSGLKNELAERLKGGLLVVVTHHRFKEVDELFLSRFSLSGRSNVIVLSSNGRFGYRYSNGGAPTELWSYGDETFTLEKGLAALESEIKKLNIPWKNALVFGQGQLVRNDQVKSFYEQGATVVSLDEGDVNLPHYINREENQFGPEGALWLLTPDLNGLETTVALSDQLILEDYAEGFIFPLASLLAVDVSFYEGTPQLEKGLLVNFKDGSSLRLNMHKKELSAKGPAGDEMVKAAQAILSGAGNVFTHKDLSGHLKRRFYQELLQRDFNDPNNFQADNLKKSFAPELIEEIRRSAYGLTADEQEKKILVGLVSLLDAASNMALPQWEVTFDSGVRGVSRTLTLKRGTIERRIVLQQGDIQLDNVTSIRAVNAIIDGIPITNSYPASLLDANHAQILETFGSLTIKSGFDQAMNAHTDWEVVSDTIEDDQRTLEFKKEEKSLSIVLEFDPATSIVTATVNGTVSPERYFKDLLRAERSKILERFAPDAAMVSRREFFKLAGAAGLLSMNLPNFINATTSALPKNTMRVQDFVAMRPFPGPIKFTIKDANSRNAELANKWWNFRTVMGSASTGQLLYIYDSAGNPRFVSIDEIGTVSIPADTSARPDVERFDAAMGAKSKDQAMIIMQYFFDEMPGLLNKAEGDEVKDRFIIALHAWYTKHKFFVSNQTLSNIQAKMDVRSYQESNVAYEIYFNMGINNTPFLIFWINPKGEWFVAEQIKNNRFAQMETFRLLEFSDGAMTAKGGIDMNPALNTLTIDREGKGVQIPVSELTPENFNPTGLVPVIINIAPITNLPLLLGMADTTPNVPSQQEFFKQAEPLKSRELEEHALL